MTPRPSFSARQRAAIFRDNDGRCHICTRLIAPGEEWEVEHVKARGFNGSDDRSNLRPSHRDCHKPKTRKDRAMMADADRALVRHVGLAKSKTKWPKRRLSAEWRM